MKDGKGFEAKVPTPEVQKPNFRSRLTTTIRSTLEATAHDSGSFLGYSHPKRGALNKETPISSTPQQLFLFGENLGFWTLDMAKAAVGGCWIYLVAPWHLWSTLRIEPLVALLRSRTSRADWRREASAWSKCSAWHGVSPRTGSKTDGVWVSLD